MKLTKEDYMRLPKERLAELLAEMDDVKIEPIVIPKQPTTPPNEPWRSPYNPYPFGPVITYADSPNTSESHPDPNIYAQQ